MIIFADPQTFYHPNYRESDSDVLSNTLSFIKQLFRDADKLGYTHIFCGGDLVEKARPHMKVEEYLINLFQDMYREYPTIKFYCSTGNHDIPRGFNFEWGKPYPETILNVLSAACKNFHIGDTTGEALAVYQNLKGDISTTVHSEVYMMPYFRSEKDFLEALKIISDKPKRAEFKYLIMHQDVTEIIPASQVSSNHVLFKGFDKIFNGHIHQAQRLTKRFHIIGSPMEMKGGDALYGEPKSYITLEDNKIERVPITGFPVFRKLQEGEELPDTFNYTSRVAKPREVSEETILDDTTNENRTLIVEKGFDLEADAAQTLANIISSLSEETEEQKQLNVEIHGFEVEGIRSLVLPVRLDLDSYPLTYYFGKIGSGKSSMLVHALYWILTGDTLSGNQDSIIPVEKLSSKYSEFKGTRGMMHLSINGVGFHIARHLKYKGKTFGETGSSTFIVFDADQKRLDLNDIISLEEYESQLKGPSGDILTGKKLLNKQWELMLGVSPSILINAIFFDASRSTLIEASNKDRHAVISKMVNTEWVQKVYLELAKRHSTWTQKVQGYSVKVDHERQILTTQSNNLNELTTLRDQELSTLRNRRVEIESSIEKLKGDQITVVPELESAKEALSLAPSANTDDLEVQLVKRKDELKSILSTLKSHKADLEYYTKGKQIYSTKERIEEFDARIESLTKELEAQTGNKDKAATKLEEFNKDVDTAQYSIDQIHRKRKDKIQGIQDVKAVVLSLMEDIKHLEDNTCPVCKQNYKDSEEMLAQKKKALSDEKATGRSLQAEVISLDEQEQVYSEQIVSLKVILDPLMTELSELEASVLKSRDEISVVRQEKSLSENTLNYLISNLGDKPELSEADLNIEIDKVDTRRSMMVNTIKELQGNLESEDIKKRNNFRKEKEQEIDRLEKELLRIIEEKNSLKYELNTLKEQVILDKYQNLLSDKALSIDNQLQLVQQLETERDQAQLNLDIYNSLNKSVVRSNKLERQVIATKLEKINDYAYRYGSTLGILLEISMDEKSNYKINITRHGIETDALNLSSGEKLVANLIWLLSLNDLLNENINFNCLVIDEPFKNLEGTDGHLIVELLAEKSKDKNLHIITHAETLDTSNARSMFFKRGKGTTTKIS